VQQERALPMGVAAIERNHGPKTPAGVCIELNASMIPSDWI
jgi:hypothetical protein